MINWIGYVFYPILKLAGFSDAALLTQSCAISILDPMCVLTFIAGQELLLVSRFLVATLGVTALVFFAGFVPVSYTHLDVYKRQNQSYGCSVFPLQA